MLSHDKYLVPSCKIFKAKPYIGNSIFIDAIETGGNSGGRPRSSQRDFRVFCCQRGQRFIVGKVKFIGNGLKLIGDKVKFIGIGGYVISLQQFQSIRIKSIMLNIRSELTQQKSLDGVVAR